MIGGRRAGLRRHLDAGTRAELVGVDPGAEPLSPAGREHGGGLVRAERTLLAEHVNPAGVRGARGQHRAADQIHVTGHVAGELGRHDVRAQVGDLGRDLGGQRQPAFLVADGEPVAGLALERGRALPEHLGRQPPQVGPQRAAGRGPGRGHRGQDAARLIRAARHPGRELGAALPREDQVRVRVDEPGQHGPAACVDDRIRGGRPGRGPGPGHHAVLDDQRRIRAGGEGAGVRVVSDQLTDRRDQRAVRRGHRDKLAPGGNRSGVRVRSS